jgi:Ca2+-binding RTX toxin-like protein
MGETLVVIDAQVDAFDQLFTLLQPNVSAIALQPDQDGVAQITAALRRFPAIRDVHLVAHGAPGCLQLGNTSLSLSTIKSYAAQLQQWFQFSASASLCLYACNVAAGDAGAEFVEQLHHLTRASIAASAQPVGHVDQGGSWELHYRLGNLTPQSVFSAHTPTAYPALLNLNYNESSSRDLTSNLAVPTDLGSVASGDNTITGSLSGTYEFDEFDFEPNGDDADAFSFSIPSGFVVSQVSLTTSNFQSPLDYLGRSFSGGLERFFISGNTTFSNLITVPGGLLPGRYDYQVFALDDSDEQPNAPFRLDYVFNLTVVANTSPTDISLDNNQIAENSAVNTLVGTFSTADTWGRGHTYSLVSGTGDSGNSLFKVVGNQLQVNGSIDFETQSAYSIRVRTTDALGASFDEVLTINVTDVVENSAPTDLRLSSTSVNENVADNTSVGSFSTTDAEGGNFTYALISGTGDTDNSAFTITGNQLTINSSPDFESQSSYSIRVKTTDAGGLSFEKVLTLSINDVNEAPVFTSGTTATFEENKTGIVYTASATDPEKAALSYSLDGTDANLFAINASTGAVTFKTAPNFEAPADSGLNNVYDITVTTSTAVGPSASRAVAITVNNVNEAPTVTGETVSTSQNTGNPATSVTVELGDNLSDPDANGLANALLNVTGTTNGTIASIDQDARLVTFTPTAGFSGTASFNYTLTDAGGLTSNTATVTVDVGSIISTGNRNQEIEGNNGDDIISAGNGSDRILGLGGNDRLFGNNGNDFLDGGDGNDSLFGGNGTDTLLGGNGNDLLNGGNGPDILTGGGGSDSFVLTATAGGDTFTDFTDTVDRIALSGGLSFGQLTIAASGGNTAILLGTTTLATLTGINSGLITAADFVTV